MMQNKENFLLYGEFRPNLASLSLTINMPMKIDSIRCKLSSAGTVMFYMDEFLPASNEQEKAQQNPKQDEKNCAHSCLVSGLPHINTDVCSNLQLIRDEVSFRLKATEYDDYFSHVLETENVFKSYFSSSGGLLLCFQCNNSLTSEICFEASRVLELPSDEWSETSDGWFCHQDHNHGDDNHADDCDNSENSAHIDCGNSAHAEYGKNDYADCKRDEHSGCGKYLHTEFDDIANVDCGKNLLAECGDSAHANCGKSTHVDCAKNARVDCRDDVRNGCRKSAHAHADIDCLKHGAGGTDSSVDNGDNKTYKGGSFYCLIGKDQVVIPASILREGSTVVSQIPGGCLVYCARCQSLLNTSHSKALQALTGLGFCSTRMISLQTFALKFRHSYIDLKGFYQFSDVLEYRLSGMLSQVSSQCGAKKIIIERRSSSAKYSEPWLLVWLMDSDLVTYLVPVDTIDHTVKPVRVVQLLYSNCLTAANNSVQAMWKHDFTVERVELDFAVCTSLLQLLLRNTRQLPLSLQRLDKFYMSYLRHFQETV